MRRACIDIGSNTTRLLVADCHGGELQEVRQLRAFTHVRRGLDPEGAITEAKIDEVRMVVAAQLVTARALGAQEVVAVATAAVRRANNGHRLIRALRDSCGLPLRILSEDEEARLAFLGACGALPRSEGSESVEELGVADVGGGSSELVVGIVPDRIIWCVSLPIGSGVLADACLASDPPAPAEIEAASARVREVLSTIDVPTPTRAVAVGGSAASLRRLAGGRLDADAFGAALTMLLDAPAIEVAQRTGLDVERVRLLPAGLVILREVQRAFGPALELVGGGLREGVLLDLERS